MHGTRFSSLVGPRRRRIIGSVSLLVGRWCETKSKAMTCCGCGYPPWDHSFNVWGDACCCLLHQHVGDHLNASYKQQTHSCHHCVAPCFSFTPFLHPAVRVHALTHCPKQVRRKRLKETGPHERKDVFENYPGVFSDPSDVDAMAGMLDKERKDVRDWATKKLRSQMLQRAHALNLEVNGRQVNKHADISKSWEANRSDANAKKMYEILFGDFEGTNVAWSRDWEEEFLKEHGREYVRELTEAEDKKIGCYRTQIAMSKIAQVKNINRNFEWKIQMSVPKEHMGDRSGRRKRGDFYLTNKLKVCSLVHDRGQVQKQNLTIVRLQSVHAGNGKKDVKCRCESTGCSRGHQHGRGERGCFCQ